jgi:hypothetical protein
MAAGRFPRRNPARISTLSARATATENRHQLSRGDRHGKGKFGDRIYVTWIEYENAEMPATLPQEPRG